MIYQSLFAVLIPNSPFFSIDATFSKRKGKFVNDDVPAKANAKMRLLVMDKKPVLALFAKREINVNEEIRYDYGVNNLPWRGKEGMTAFNYLQHFLVIIFEFY